MTKEQLHVQKKWKPEVLKTRWHEGYHNDVFCIDIRDKHFAKKEEEEAWHEAFVFTLEHEAEINDVMLQIVALDSVRFFVSEDYAPAFEAVVEKVDRELKKLLKGMQ